ncbi:uncharacterized protein LOC116298761 [Actinia tenebrosa]|uniref:Uncharacterized protein LOC116298761 n=1 Tax=Actinia tenebrosa TaxID=6105 RepID=A0A6P8ID24_ACTTE|nr:uncharacterized protein LOC116298761 [Actinia tenebrosa]
MFSKSEAFFLVMVVMMAMVFADAAKHGSERRGGGMSKPATVIVCQVTNQPYEGIFRHRRCLVDNPNIGNKNTVCETHTDPYRSHLELDRVVKNTNCAPGHICCEGYTMEQKPERLPILNNPNH